MITDKSKWVSGCNQFPNSEMSSRSPINIQPQQTLMTLQTRRQRRRKRPMQKFHKTMLMPLMLSLKTKWFTGNFLRKFMSLIPLRYKPDYAFEQEWETTDVNRNADQNRCRDDGQTFFWVFNQTDKRYSVLQTVQLFLCCLALWYTSIRDLLEVPDQHPFMGFFSILLMILSLGNLVIELLTVHIVDNRQLNTFRETLKYYCTQELPYDLCCLVSGAVYMVEPPSNYVSSAFSAIVSMGLLFKISKQTKFFNELLEQTSMSRYFKVFNVLGFMLFTAHIFSIILNVLADNLGQNWLVRIGKAESSWAIRYLYAMYWSITTMVTVGYGDIVPANHYEVIVIMFIELFGSTLSAYLINTIGSTLSNLRKQAQKMDYDLNVLKKTSKYFSLSNELTYRIRNCLENNQKVETTFSAQDQKSLMDSLNEQLRRDVIYQTNIKVIKKSVFFMSHFTKNFRSQVALRLIKKIYQPNQTLQINSQSPSLFIVDKGAVNISVRFQYRNRIYEKTIRKIVENGQNEVRLNMYGLAGLLQAGFPLRTCAKAQTFVFAYELTRHDFLELIQNNPLDFQTFYQLRDQLYSLRLPEAVEGQSLIDEKKHYCPRRILLLRKYCYSQSQPRTPQSNFYSQLRKERRSKTVLPKGLPEINIVRTTVVSLLDEFQPPPENIYVRRENHIDVYRNYDSYFVFCNPTVVFDKYEAFNSKMARKS